MALTFNKFDIFVQDVGRKVHNLNSDTLNFALSNVAPVAGNTVIANITQIAAGNGYSTGGASLTAVSFTQAAGLAKLLGTAPTWTASGTMATFRYIVLYNLTAAGGPLIGWYDRGAGLALADTETYTPTTDAGNGILTIQ